MAESSIEYLIKEAKDKNNPYWKRRQTIEEAKENVARLLKEITKVEKGMR